MTGCLVSKRPILYVNDWFRVAVVTNDILPNRSAYGLAAYFEKCISSLSANSIKTKPYEYKSTTASMNSTLKPLAKCCRPAQDELGEMTLIVLIDSFSMLITFHSHLIRKLVRPLVRSHPVCREQDFQSSFMAFNVCQSRFDS